jgi:hypothetical protein
MQWVLPCYASVFKLVAHLDSRVLVSNCLQKCRHQDTFCIVTPHPTPPRQWPLKISVWGIIFHILTQFMLENVTRSSHWLYSDRWLVKTTCAIEKWMTYFSMNLFQIGGSLWNNTPVSLSLGSSFSWSNDLCLVLGENPASHYRNTSLIFIQSLSDKSIDWYTRSRVGFAQNKWDPKHACQRIQPQIWTDIGWHFSKLYVQNKVLACWSSPAWLTYNTLGGSMHRRFWSPRQGTYKICD